MQTGCEKIAYLRKYSLVGDSRLVSIALYPDVCGRVWKGRKYNCLAPTPELFRDMRAGWITEGEYEERFYSEILDHRDPLKAVADLGTDAILLCWCLPRAFCHRHLVAQWLEAELEIAVPEIK